ncbi:SDR family oxidoreductase [Methylibium sp.]|jgi:uncharacterized protein YbjT (DUF2867 family)|uniref:SDR family oxidoreductase n=1 Tax=Methylibium sp. TaxID=2067992 RepID=UPI003D0E1781|eukprot:TRINITY_DN8125_c1_g1_i1.p3 TRINITY_DN8125_c1_g1~~TRINITY_DN8125_c1_g1_i1.p3  ORF type:complete len:289 (+),score=72.40 TRINITY_DN8125_c1_g1_i1:339-1205(+)
MKILVIGGTGTIGSRVVNGLLSKGVNVNVMTRDPAKATGLPKGATAVFGNLSDPHATRDSFKGIDRVFMLNAASTAEAYEGIMGVLLAKDADVGRFVYMSTHRADLTEFLPIGGGTKLPVEKAVAISGMPFTILRPNNFFQNDYWYKDSMLNDGIYPQPIGFKGMSRVDARDIADVAVSTLLNEGHAGQTYNITGPRVETGPSSAAAWSTALNRKIEYAGNDMELFERMHGFMGSALVNVYRRFYEFYQEHGLFATEQDIAGTTRLLGRAPRSLESFAIETAKEWAAK